MLRLRQQQKNQQQLVRVRWIRAEKKTLKHSNTTKVIVCNLFFSCIIRGNRVNMFIYIYIQYTKLARWQMFALKMLNDSLICAEHISTEFSFLSSFFPAVVVFFSRCCCSCCCHHKFNCLPNRTSTICLCHIQINAREQFYDLVIKIISFILIWCAWMLLMPAIDDFLLFGRLFFPFCLISDAAPFQHKLLLPFLLQLLNLHLTSVFLCLSFLLYLIHTYIHIQIAIAFEFTVFDLECLHAVQNTNAIGSCATQCVSNCCCYFFFFFSYLSLNVINVMRKWNLPLFCACDISVCKFWRTRAHACSAFFPIYFLFNIFGVTIIFNCGSFVKCLSV